MLISNLKNFMEWKYHYLGSNGQARYIQARFGKVDEFGFWD